MQHMTTRPQPWTRRETFRALAALVGTTLPAGSALAQAVRWSTGTERPRPPLPDGAVDCHHHIYDSRFPADPRASLHPGDALPSDYRRLQERLGFERHVVVQPSTYGTDNRCLLDALSAFGRSARGIAVVNAGVADADLKRMSDLGVRGLRFNLSYPAGAPIEALKPLAARVAGLGWHIQVVAGPARIVDHADLLSSLPVPVVFDHMAQIPSVDHPAFGIVTKLLRDGKAWVKLSGAYTFSKAGPPGYADAGRIAEAYVGIAPERLVWGTDWPHPTARDDSKPDDAHLVDLISGWIGREDLRRAIYVENAIKLYDF